MATLLSDEFCVDSLQHVIDESLLLQVKRKGIEHWFPVQSQVIPLLAQTLSIRQQFRPRDLCICSPTGSGKTLTFVLPIVQHLMFKLQTSLRVLVLLPGTDLATQIQNEFLDICKGTAVKVGSAIGSRPLSEDLESIFYSDHRGKLFNKIDVLIATPGKLYDLLHNVPEFNLTNLETLVMDEADRIINSPLEHDFVDLLHQSVFGSLKEIGCTCERNLLDSTVEGGLEPTIGHSQFNEGPTLRYCLSNKLNGCALNHYDGSHNLLRVLFTATLTQDPEKLHKFKLFCPRFLNFTTHKTISNEINLEAAEGSEEQQTIQKWALPDTLVQRCLYVSDDYKPAMIWFLIKELKYKRMLCFANSKEDVYRLCKLLKTIPGVRAIEWSGQIKPDKRKKYRKWFAEGKVDIIVCSDIIARGIDFEDVAYVINYDIPQRPHTYLHRVGRTARAGRPGTAITLLSKSENAKFQIIWRSVIGRSAQACPRQSVDMKKFQPYCDQYQEYLTLLKKNVHKDKILPKLKQNNLVRSVKTFS